MRFCILALGLWLASPATAQEAPVNPADPIRCMRCHGLDGLAVNRLWPHLAGQPVGYLVRQLKLFRDGRRRDRGGLMANWARPMSDEHIRVLARLYSSLPRPAAQQPLIGDVEAGREAAITCNGCHGKDGLSVNEIWPNLAGQNQLYMREALKAYRAGERRDPRGIMAAWARRLTDREIDDLSAYYASLGD